MREIIKQAAMKLEFVTGLKQMREYSEDQVKELLDTLTECAQEYVWLTPSTLEYILKNGMRGRYGEFYHLNEKTLTGWIKSYYKDNEQKINLSILKKEDDREFSEEEKLHWLEVGKENFRQKFQESKDGFIAPLSEWGPYFYTNFVRDGILIEENYPIDMEVIAKELRIAGREYEDHALLSRKKEKIWRMFIKDMISQGVDLSGYL